MISKLFIYKLNNIMPTHKVKGGYRWGKHGKIYPTKAQADKQGKAIYASGWREIKENKNMVRVKITENDLKQMVNESVKRILSELENPWLYGGDDRCGDAVGGFYIGSLIFNAVCEKYKYEYDDQMEDFEVFLGELPIIYANCGWENSPSINYEREWINYIYDDDVEKLKQEILTYDNKVLANQALEVLDSVLDNLDIDDAIFEEEPDYD